MKKALLFLSIFFVVVMACNLAETAVPSASPVPLPTATLITASDAPTQNPPSASPLPATLVPASTSTAPVPSFEGVDVFYGSLSLVLPPGLATGISGNQFPRSEGADVAPWGVTPGHTQLTLEGYLLQGKFHQPEIFVYPAQDYAEQNPGAFESIHRLNNILFDPAAPIGNQQLPLVPFFNAAQVFASNIQVVSFQNGQGVRFLTEYAQYAAAVNNYDLFYQFHGVTSDGAYYIIAILPVTAPVLAETSDSGAILPPGGIPYPDMTNSNADWQGYYAAVSALLNATPPETFAPTLNQLDSLVQSMRVTQ